MAKVCPTCGGKGKADLFQLSDYFDPCPTCDGSGEVSEAKPLLTKGQLTAFRVGFGKAFRKGWGVVASIFWVMLIMAFAFVFLVAAGAPLATKKRQCESGGGAFVTGGLFSPDECWAADGTRRLFPEGWH